MDGWQLLRFGVRVPGGRHASWCGTASLEALSGVRSSGRGEAGQGRYTVTVDQQISLRVLVTTVHSKHPELARKGQDGGVLVVEQRYKLPT